MKRILDYVLSIIVVFLFSPLIIFLLLIIFIQGENPIFFTTRVGKNSKNFMMPKIRTMKKNAPLKATELFTKKELKKYLLFLGFFIRKTNLDELLQFISVLKGDMSIVGPRPLFPSQKKLIKLRKQKKIDKILPGITGMAQVNDNSKKLKNKIFFDNQYFKNQSLVLDLKILVKTVFLIFKKLLGCGARI